MAKNPFPRLIRALARCTFPVGSWDKRFVRNMLDREEFSEKQQACILRLVHRYRRQIPTDIINAQDAAEALRSAGKVS